MDFYIAALGRSGSTALANWLTTPPTHVVFHEPNLLRSTPTRLLASQLDDWDMTKEQAMAGHWAVKETSSDMHDDMLAAYAPSKVILCVRNIADAALSLFEKHRRQEVLDRYSDDWAADYLVREAEGLVRLARQLENDSVEFAIFRYEEFGESSLRKLADWIEWPGGGEMSRGFQAFGRAFEMQRERSRDLTPEMIRLAGDIAERCAAFDQRFYGSG